MTAKIIFPEFERILRLIYTSPFYKLSQNILIFEIFGLFTIYTENPSGLKLC
jgi:hypothetical protein